MKQLSEALPPIPAHAPLATKTSAMSQRQNAGSTITAGRQITTADMPIQTQRSLSQQRQETLSRITALNLTIREEPIFGPVWDPIAQRSEWGQIAATEHFEFTGDIMAAERDLLEGLLPPGDLVGITSMLGEIGTTKTVWNVQNEKDMQTFLAVHAKAIRNFGWLVIKLALDDIRENNKSKEFPQPAEVREVCQFHEKIFIAAINHIALEKRK